VLLDENLPQKLRLLLSAHKVVTAAYQGWAGKSNGALIVAAEAAGFDVLVTPDQGLNYQQNMKGRKLALVVLSTNKNSLVMAAVTKISAAINATPPGGFAVADVGH
jgi:predicted nuclease of predicted toxin-antitoxin system